MSNYYSGLTHREEYIRVTEELIDKHPLKDELIKLCFEAWNIVNNIEIDILDEKLKLRDINSEGSLYGGLIDKVLSKLIVKIYSDNWRMNSNKSDKDVVNINNDELSIEIKSGGQKICKIFGNASYNNKERNKELIKKSIEGYYVTLNYWNDTLYLIRFGWLDEEDWKPQEKKSGQQSKIRPTAYQLKLDILYGDYLLNTPCNVINGIDLEIDYKKNSEKTIVKKEIYRQLKNLDGILKYRGNNDDIIKYKSIFLFTGIVLLSGGDTSIDLWRLGSQNQKVLNIILEEIIYSKCKYIKKGDNKHLINEEIDTIKDILSYNGNNKKVLEVRQEILEKGEIRLKSKVINSVVNNFINSYRETVMEASSFDRVDLALSEEKIRETIERRVLKISLFEKYSGQDEEVLYIKELIKASKVK